MFVCTQTPEFFNDLSESIRAFYPEAELEMTELPNSDGDGILHTMELCGGYAVSKAVLMRHGTAEGEQTVRMPLGEGALAVKRSRKKKRQAFGVLSVAGTYGQAASVGLAHGNPPYKADLRAG